MNSLRNRILFIFTFFAFLSLVAIYLGHRGTRIVGKAAESVVSKHLPMVHALGQMEVALIKQEAAVYRFLRTKDKTWKDGFEKGRQGFYRAFVDAEKVADTQIELDELIEIDELYVQYANSTKKILLSAGKSSPSNVAQKLREADKFLSQIKKHLEKIEGLRQGITLARQKDIGDTLKSHGRIGAYFLGAIVLFFIILALYLWHYLVKPLSLLIHGIRNFTRGRMDVQIPPVGKDELGELQDAFNEMAREIAGERKRLKSESQSDSLTGLFNMRYFRMQLTEEFSRSQRYTHPLTLLMIDVDHFKDYNDRNGHPAGDIVLKEISRILIRNVRGTDIVARYGGEEFVVLLPETTSDSAKKVAEKIRQAVENHHFPFQENMGAQRITISVGISSYPDRNVTSDHDLLESSDKALYHAKKNGRNKVSIYSEIVGGLSKSSRKKTSSK